MDGSPVLRQQSQNKILRTKGEHNKMTVDNKFSKVLSLHPVRHNLENHDPVNSEHGHPPHVRLGVSKLPVLAKSLHLQSSREFTQSHSKWEEKPLAGKTRTKKPCTRPVPFNFSQPKCTRIASENKHHSTRTSKNVCSSQIKTSRNSKHSGILQENVRSTKSSVNAPQPLGQSRHPPKTSVTVSKAMSCTQSFPENCAAAAEKSTAAEICSKNMNLLSLKDASSITKQDNFQHDHAALLSILFNEGVTATMTSQSKPYNCLPQRVSVMKSCQKAGPKPGCSKSVAFSPDSAALQSILKNEGVKAGDPSVRAPSIYTPMRVPVKKNVAEKGIGLIGSSMKMVQFSPDPTALQSVLQNEGVKVVCPGGATPRNSMCPAGRSTSIYTAQRVPVKKNLSEPSPGPAVAARKQNTVQKWTPQRVPRHQSISAMKLHTSQPSPYAGTPGFRSNKEVVQKLFEEEDEENTEVTMPQTELLTEQTTCKGERWGPKADEKGENGLHEEQILGPFIQNPERDSVIVFSTGKKLFRDPHFKKSDHKWHNPEDTRSVQSRQTSATVETGIKDLLTQTDVINPAVAMLRKRLPLLEELLDEEVATYTSVSVPAVSGFHPPRPRCGNPVATILHFEEATRFVPISFDMSPESRLSS